MKKLQTEKCQAIMKATLELVAEQGFVGAPTSQIAGRAGVGVGSIYRYFKDKDELIHAIQAQLENRMSQALAEGFDGELPDREQFIWLLTKLIKHLIANPIDFKFMEQYFNSPYGIEKMREKFLEESIPLSDAERPLLSILSRGRGETIKDLPKPIIHALAFGPVILMVRDHLTGVFELHDELIQQAAAAGWDAIKI